MNIQRISILIPNYLCDISLSFEGEMSVGIVLRQTRETGAESSVLPQDRQEHTGEFGWVPEGNPWRKGSSVARSKCK